MLEIIKRPSSFTKESLKARKESHPRSLEKFSKTTLMKIAATAAAAADP